jgi:hypothetical protein
MTLLSHYLPHFLCPYRRSLLGYCLGSRRYQSVIRLYFRHSMPVCTSFVRRTIRAQKIVYGITFNTYSVHWIFDPASPFLLLITMYIIMCVCLLWDNGRFDFSYEL